LSRKITFVASCTLRYANDIGIDSNEEHRSRRLRWTPRNQRTSMHSGTAIMLKTSKHSNVLFCRAYPKSCPSQEPHPATTLDKRSSSSPPPNTACLHPILPPKHTDETTRSSSNDIIPRMTAINHPVLLPKHSSDFTSSMTTISQDSIPDRIARWEPQSDTPSLILSEEPSDIHAVDQQNDRAQLQQWVYETRNPVLTVSERLEKSRWETGERTNIDR